MRILLFATALLASTALPSFAADPVTTPEDQKALTLTVYQQNIALVREQRRVTLPGGRSRLAVIGVPSALRPETVLTNAATPDRIRVLGQVYESALLTPEALLRASVGSTVQVVTRHPETGVESFAAAQVLRAQGREALVRIDGRIRTLDVRRIAFDNAPSNLRARPTLVLDIASNGAGAEDLTLSYLTGGLNWKTDYVARLAEDETSIQLAGWVTLTNGTETSFENPRLRVVAGSINQARRPVRRQKAVPGIMAMRADASRELPASTAVSDLRVFDFPDTVTIRAKEKRQLALLTAAAVKVQKQYRLDGNNSGFNRLQRGVQRSSPTVRYRLENKADAGLGRALPSGTVRLYVPSAGGDLLRGESNIRYTPVGEKATLTVGSAADITSERRQTDFRRDGLPKNVVETAHRITLRNAKDEAVTVDVVENIPGDWRMLEESQPHSKRSAGQAEWNVTVPAGGETELTYRVRTRF
ncbi:MAG: DUF4139 domain-containing protein [Rhodospirillaceae bacterium]|nr:DUF4139 domain-containing protein [Rhodospirillaceae bacterium]MDD9927580.1 DUF4139 domain-containing protein [Rhodospirillaceae bacterium]